MAATEEKISVSVVLIPSQYCCRDENPFLCVHTDLLRSKTTSVFVWFCAEHCELFHKKGDLDCILVQNGAVRVGFQFGVILESHEKKIDLTGKNRTGSS